MLKAVWKPYTLDFNFEARTSRAVMLHKDTYFLKVWDTDAPEICGLGECPLFKGLSKEDDEGFESRLDALCGNFSEEALAASTDSSIRFGWEMALADLRNGGVRAVHPESLWLAGKRGIKINGLIWMGDFDLMFRRISEKLENGFKCLKLKIGGIRFDDELELLRFIRSKFSPESLELRLDANGAFTPDNALERISKLAKFDIHSLEQPIKAGQPDEMARICLGSDIPIALDEELIGTTDMRFKHELLTLVRPAYVILKPALCGGFSDADDWIAAAVESGTGWWATSALESNVGLDAIAQWVDVKNPEMPQGLGTGSLYINNIPSPITLVNDELRYDPAARAVDLQI